jgi:hypothetical protein
MNISNVFKWKKKINNNEELNSEMNRKKNQWDQSSFNFEPNQSCRSRKNNNGFQRLYHWTEK